MVWQVKITNNSGSSVVAPAFDTVNLTSALIFTKFGTINLVDIGHQPNGPHYWAIQVTSGAFNQIFWYDGGGLCELTINADGSFTAVGQGNSLQGTISGPMGRIFQLPSSKRIYITGVTNAAWTQRATLTVDGMGASLIWAGAGEDNHEFSNTFVDSRADQSGWINAGVLIEHQQPGAAWLPSSMSPVGPYQLLGYNFRMLAAEDGADQDYNDCGLSLQWWTLPQS
jgi:hypothetical protein